MVPTAVSSKIARPAAADTLVSVIIPAFNRRSLLLQAISSVQAQTHRHTEIIVVDDGSTDGTAEAVRTLPGVRYRQQDRAGPAAARNRGLALATGDFVASLDSDDLWAPTFLERCLAALQAEGLDMVFANWRHCSGEPSYLSRWETAGDLDPFRDGTFAEWAIAEASTARAMFCRSCLAPSSSMLVRRSSLPSGWNPELRMADDWYLLLEMVLCRPCRVGFTTSPLWLKRIASDNRYDGQPFKRVLLDLYVHDHGIFRRDFGPLLTRRERVRFAARQTGYPAVLDVGRSLRDRLLSMRRDRAG